MGTPVSRYHDVHTSNDRIPRVETTTSIKGRGTTETVQARIEKHTYTFNSRRLGRLSIDEEKEELIKSRVCQQWTSRLSTSP